MPAENQQAVQKLEFNTPDAGRAYIAKLFETVLRRHDYRQYINERLAGDFACALAQHFEEIKARETDLQLLLKERDEQNHSLEQRRQAEQQACMAAERRAEELQAEVERLKSMSSDPFDRMRDLQAELTKAQDLLRNAWHVTPAWWAARNAFLSNQSAPADKGHVGPLSELEVLRAAVKELEAMRDARVDAKLGRGEPVAYRWRVKGHGEWTASVSKVEFDARANDDRFFAQALYAEQPAPVAVMPEYRDSDLRSPTYGFARGWNACLDEVARLNPIKQ